MEFFELVMIICFGASWPLSVIKSIRSRSTKGKSVLFIALIILGYISGLTGKIVNNVLHDTMDFIVFGAYILNLIFVSIDFVLYFVNRKREKRIEEEERLAKEQKAETANA